MIYLQQFVVSTVCCLACFALIKSDSTCHGRNCQLLVHRFVFAFAACVPRSGGSRTKKVGKRIIPEKLHNFPQGSLRRFRRLASGRVIGMKEMELVSWSLTSPFSTEGDGGCHWQMYDLLMSQSSNMREYRRREWHKDGPTDASSGKQRSICRGVGEV